MKMFKLFNVDVDGNVSLRWDIYENENFSVYQNHKCFQYSLFLFETNRIVLYVLMDQNFLICI